MNVKDKTRLQAVNAYKEKAEILCADLKWQNEILDLVLEDDRSLLVPYIDEEIAAARQMGEHGLKYAHELERLKVILMEGDNA